MPVFRSRSALIYFVHIPKAGGTSVENALKVRGVKCAMLLGKAKNTVVDYGRCTPQHIHAEVIKSQFPDGFFDYMFTVCRNPFSRIASEYKMKVLNGKEDAAPSQWITKSINRYHEFPYTRDNHIRPQVQFLAPGIEIFLLEDGLDSPIKAAFKALNVKSSSEIPHARKGSSEKLSINESTLTLIRDFYRDDFETLGYDITAHASYFDIH